MCHDDPVLAHSLLDKYTQSLCLYASHQIESGAQVIQLFESWAHHLSEADFLDFAKPYADRVAAYLKECHPDVPVVYFANGGSGYLHQQLDMRVDSLAVDWKISMKRAREVAGPNKVLCGNIDPILLYSKEPVIRAAVEQCITEAHGKHVLNLGHGVEKDTSEEAVAQFVNAAKSVRFKNGLRVQ